MRERAADVNEHIHKAFWVCQWAQSQLAWGNKCFLSPHKHDFLIASWISVLSAFYLPLVCSHSDSWFALQPRHSTSCWAANSVNQINTSYRHLYRYMKDIDRDIKAWAYGKHTVSCCCLESIYFPNQKRCRLLSVFMNLTSSHCCLSTTCLGTFTALVRLPDTQLSDTSPNSYPIPSAATHSWIALIKERGREEQRLTVKGRLINTQRQRQTWGWIIRWTDRDSYQSTGLMGNTTGRQIAQQPGWSIKDTVN